MTNFFLYARKSTDEPDRQILSIEAQIDELNEFAAREHINITQTFIESRTAKKPGRSIFNDMLRRMEKGEADGILAWHPDRLARNSVDGGKIIYLIDNSVIKEMKFPTFWFDPTPQGKFMLSIAFGQSKYYIDNLSENVRRGLRQKVRRGEYPGVAPTGYLNDRNNHTMVKDPERYHLMKKMFEMYATGNHSLKDLRAWAKENGLVSKSRKRLPLSQSNIQSLLKNPFYYGAFWYSGELHQGTHEPLVSKKLYDKCQAIMQDRSRPRKSKQPKDWAFTGLLKCGECGCAITAETQKGHTYYHCTKKRIPCSQKYIREEALDQALSAEIQKASLSEDWASAMLKKLGEEKKTQNQSNRAYAQNLRSQMATIDGKLDKLLDAQLEGVITREEYQVKKQKLINQKYELGDKLKDFEREGNTWLERAQSFISEAKQAKIIALRENLPAKRDFLKKIGSNFLLLDRKVLMQAENCWRVLYEYRALTSWLWDLASNQDHYVNSVGFYQLNYPRPRPP